MKIAPSGEIFWSPLFLHICAAVWRLFPVDSKVIFIAGYLQGAMT